MADHFEPQGVVSDVPAGHENSDADLRSVVFFATALGLLLIVVLAGLGWMFHAFSARENAIKRPVSPLITKEPEGQRRFPPAPRLEGLEEPSQPAQVQAKQEAATREYGWVDRKQGIVRIPVRQAMKILAQKLQASPSDQKSERREQGPNASNSGRSSQKGEQ